MNRLDSLKALQQVHAIVGGPRLYLKPWEEVEDWYQNDDSLIVNILTYQVQELTREDRYKKRGSRILWYKRIENSWHLSKDYLIWDEDFVPFTQVKYGKRQTADEFQEQREFEKMCHRPGTKQTPLDNYDRVWNDKSTPAMERYW